MSILNINLKHEGKQPRLAGLNPETSKTGGRASAGSALRGSRDDVFTILRRACVRGMARLEVAPLVADKILNHQAGTISGVAAVYQRHDFLAERRAALDLWGAHVERVLGMSQDRRSALKIVA